MTENQCTAMLSSHKVLTVTKRTASLCGLQTLLYSSGFEMVTATNMIGARSVLNAMPLRAVIICRHSWSDAEREALTRELAASYPAISVVLHCPGCTGCDEAAGRAGVLPASEVASGIIWQIGSFPKA